MQLDLTWLGYAMLVANTFPHWGITLNKSVSRLYSVSSGNMHLLSFTDIDVHFVDPLVSYYVHNKTNHILFYLCVIYIFYCDNSEWLKWSLLSSPCRDRFCALSHFFPKSIVLFFLRRKPQSWLLLPLHYCCKR